MKARGRPMGRRPWDSFGRAPLFVLVMLGTPSAEAKAQEGVPVRDSVFDARRCTLLGRTSPVPEFPPDSIPSGALADSIYSPENRVSDPRLGDRVPSDVVLVSFDPGARQELRQGAVELVGGRVIGGVPVHPGAWYIIRIRSDGTAEPLVDAIEALEALPQVRAATPHITALPEP